MCSYHLLLQNLPTSNHGGKLLMQPQFLTISHLFKLLRYDIIRGKECFILHTVLYSVCKCDTTINMTHRDNRITTITSTNKVVNNVTIAINNKLMATHTNFCNSTAIIIHVTLSHLRSKESAGLHFVCI